MAVGQSNKIFSTHKGRLATFVGCFCTLTCKVVWFTCIITVDIIFHICDCVERGDILENNEDRMLVRIAEMYYLENKNQSEIAKELNIHRTTISRLLKRARNEQIVNITINYDKAGTYIIEKKLVEKYNIRKAIVVPVAPDLSREQKDLLLASNLGDYLKEILHNDMNIGFSWGATMAAVPKGLPNLDLENILCIPMIGGPSGRLSSEYHVNTIAYEAAKKLNGKALMIDSPAFPETLDLKKSLMENDYNQKLIDYWRSLDIAIMGIGTPALKVSESWKQFYGEDVLCYLEEKNVAGDIVSRFYDNQGNHIDNQLDNRIIGIDINVLKRIDYKIGIASMYGKVDSIHAALLGKYINVLVTTEEIAKKLLEK